MSSAIIAKQYGVKEYNSDTGRVRELAPVWSYGQAMNTASIHADRFPERIIFVEVRNVIMDPWEDVDFDMEEQRLREIGESKAAKRRAEEKADA